LGEAVAFQPFGYVFEIRSPLPPAAAAAAIRSRKKGWFHHADGARGWIVGPFVCLWLSAFDRYGPMLFARISGDDFGSKVAGRAGSDLNGIALLAGLLPLMAWLLYESVAAGDYTLKYLAITGGVILISPLAFWWSHKNRREAEPLVRFLEDTLTSSGRALRAKLATASVSRGLTLNVAGKAHDGRVTPDAIHDALLSVGAGGFVILAKSDEAYIQTALQGGGYILEMRDGDVQQHFRAVRRSGVAAGDQGAVFIFEEVRETLMAYAAEAPMPRFLMWERMHTPEAESR
jgi:hypothetical protein